MTTNLQDRWSSWLIERNRRGMRFVLIITLALYPAFGVLDYLLAPRDALPILYGTRLLVAVTTLALFGVIQRQLFARHFNLISSTYILLAASGISVMTVFMGGLESSYYAGLSLVIVGTGLLFVWPMHVVLAVHVLILLSFLVPNLLLAHVGNRVDALSNLAFLMATAIITGTGQIVLFGSQRKQIVDQIALEETKASLEKAHDELKQLDSFKSHLFANITHEFKTPLAMVLAPLELMLQGEMGPLSTAHQTTFQSMFRSGLKLLKMIGDLLDLSRLEESKLRLKVAEQDLGEYLRGLVAQVQPLAERKGIELQLLAGAERSVVWCDIERLERVFLNLLSNATKFTPPGGHIKVALLDLGTTVQVVVQDDGPGFPPDKAEQIFERFYQVDMGGTRRYGGTGIGLALAKEIVELHGGNIRAESAGGARFTVELIKDRDHFRLEVLERRGPSRDVPAGSRANDRGLMDFAVQMAARDEYRPLDIAEATERRVSLRDIDEHLRPHVALVVDD